MDLKGKYGLIIPAKEREAKAASVANPPPSRKRNVFGEDSDSEPDEDTDWVKKTMKKQSHGSIQQRQSAQAIKQALADDPTVYQYDELYDGMEEKRANSKESQKKDRKAKYIDNLLKTAEKRKHEDEARNERLVQKEREKEGDMFKDKEAFVTGAYRKKMEELEKIKEEERRRDQLDALVDVTKQKDLSGFYRHLYRQQLDDPDKKELEAAENSSKDPEKSEEVSVKQEPDSPQHEIMSKPERTPERETKLYVKEELERKSDHSRRSPKREERRERDRHDEKKTEPRRRSRDRAHRDDRRRDDRHTRNDGGSRGDSSRNERDHDRRVDRDQTHYRDPDAKEMNRGHDHGRESDRRRNKDNDRDRSGRRDRSRSRDDRRKDEGRDRGGRRDHHERTPEKQVKLEENPEGDIIKAEVKIEEIENAAEVKPSIWVKRTVGPVLDEALARYFARKQANTLRASVVANHD